MVSYIFVPLKGGNRELVKDLSSGFISNEHAKVFENDVPDGKIERMICQHERDTT